MVNIYVALIKKGLRTLDSVPSLYREVVREILEKEEKNNN